MVIPGWWETLLQIIMMSASPVGKDREREFKFKCSSVSVQYNCVCRLVESENNPMSDPIVLWLVSLLDVCM